MSNYPLGQNEAESIASKTGKKLSQITLEEVKRGNVTAEDIKISSEMPVSYTHLTLPTNSRV